MLDLRDLVLTGGRASPPTAGLIFAARGLEGTAFGNVR